MTNEFIDVRARVQVPSLDKVNSYLQKRDWSVCEQGRRLVIHMKEANNGQEIRLSVPASETLDAYPDMISFLLRILSDIENRSEYDIVMEINTGTDDKSSRVLGLLSELQSIFEKSYT